MAPPTRTHIQVLSPRKIPALGFPSPLLTSHFMAPPLAGPSVLDIMKVAGNLSTIAAETRQVGARVKQLAERQGNRTNILEREINNIYGRLDECFNEQHKIAANVRSNWRRLQQLEERASGTSGPAGKDKSKEGSESDTNKDEVIGESIPTMNTYSGYPDELIVCGGGKTLSD